MTKKQHGSFLAGDKPEGRFVALFADGSGARLYLPEKNGGYEEGEHGTEVDFNWFIDAGFSEWMLLPEGYKLWIERD